VSQCGLSSGVTSWADVYRAERDGLVRLAYLMTGSQGVAEDLVQDTFIRVMAHIDPEGSPGAYLRRSVINACYSHHRRAWREVGSGDREQLAGMAGRGPARGRSELRASPSVTRPDAARAEGDVEMWDALDRLSPRHRAVLVLRYYLDLPEAEVAELLGCRVGTVKSTTHRALADLRKMVER
jgi:RNA polymerase sigma factor (sigma-70 family)